MTHLAERSPGNAVLCDAYTVRDYRPCDLEGPVEVDPFFHAGRLVVRPMQAAVRNGQVIGENPPRVQTADEEQRFLDRGKLSLALDLPHFDLQSKVRRDMHGDVPGEAQVFPIRVVRRVNGYRGPSALDDFPEV